MSEQVGQTQERKQFPCESCGAPMTFTRFSGQRGDAYWVSKTGGKQYPSVRAKRERRVDWISRNGSFHRFFEDLCVSALRSLPPKLLRGLEPWPVAGTAETPTRLIPFTHAALAGHRAHTYELQLDACFFLVMHFFPGDPE